MLVYRGVNLTHISDIGETPISTSGCMSSVSVFSTDYDAPSEIAQPVQMAIMPIIGKSHL